MVYTSNYIASKEINIKELCDNCINIGTNILKL